MLHLSSRCSIGQIFDKVYREGDLISPPARGIQTTLVPAGGSAVVEMDTTVPGSFTLVDHSIFRIDKGAVGFLKVRPMLQVATISDSLPSQYSPQALSHAAANFTSFAGVGEGSPPRHLRFGRAACLLPRLQAPQLKRWEPRLSSALQAFPSVPAAVSTGAGAGAGAGAGDSTCTKALLSPPTEYASAKRSAGQYL